MKRKTGILISCRTGAYSGGPWELQSSHTRPKAGSLFSWNRTAVSAEGIEAVLTVNEQLPLTQLFQEFPLEMLREKTEVQRFVSQLHTQGIDCYALMGDATWALHEQAEEVLSRLTLVADYNETSSASQRLRGVVLDIEPYLLPQWGHGRPADFIAGLCRSDGDLLQAGEGAESGGCDLPAILV